MVPIYFWCQSSELQPSTYMYPGNLLLFTIISGVHIKTPPCFGSVAKQGGFNNRPGPLLAESVAKQAGVNILL